MAQRKRNEPLDAAVEERVAANHQRASPHTCQRRERRIEVGLVAGMQDMQLDAASAEAVAPMGAGWTCPRSVVD